MQPDLFGAAELVLLAALDGQPAPEHLRLQANARLHLEFLAADFDRAMSGNSEGLARCIRRMFATRPGALRR